MEAVLAHQLPDQRSLVEFVETLPPESCGNPAGRSATGGRSLVTPCSGCTIRHPHFPGKGDHPEADRFRGILVSAPPNGTIPCCAGRPSGVSASPFNLLECRDRTPTHHSRAEISMQKLAAPVAIDLLKSPSRRLCFALMVLHVLIHGIKRRFHTCLDRVHPVVNQLLGRIGPVRLPCDDHRQ